MAGKRRAATSSKRPRRTKTLILRRTRKPKKPKTWKTRLRSFVVWSSVAVVVLVLIAGIGLVIIYKKTDLPDPNADFNAQTSIVYYDGGKDEIGRYAFQNRTSLDYDQMPQVIKDAVVAAENRSFWTDSGVSYSGILRALVNNASGNSQQGGSTITQQYIKIYYLNSESSYTRKLKEAILAKKIHDQVSKEELLQNYLNTIYFGHGAYGIQAAAQTYFGIGAKKLSLSQAAMLAAVLNNPSGLDPAGGRQDRKGLRDRFDYVLDGMVTIAGSDPHIVGIDQRAADRAKRRGLPGLDLSTENSNGGQLGFMKKMVEQQLETLKDDNGDPFTEDRIVGGGLRITTTFQPKAMDAARKGVMDGKPDGFGDKQLHIGVATVEPGTGAVRGFYAGQDYLDSELNWAVAGGQAGSTFKPFALAAALEDGYSLRDTFDGNSPLTLADGSTVNNEGDTDYGSAVNLLTGVEKSINTVFVDLTNSMPDGPQRIVDTANKMGIPPAEADKKHPFGIPTSTPGLAPITGVSLGSQTVSPINMANAYATIANGGEAADPYIIDKVTDADGNVLYQHEVTTHRAISSDIAADVSYALQENVKYGTGQGALQLGRSAAGKTGTATNDKDQVSSAWFAGFTPQLSTAVMYVRGDGNDQLDGWLPSFYGADYPTTTWTDVMRYALDGTDPEEFPPPAFVDGTAPEPGHSYVSPTKKPTKTPTKKPTKTDSATDQPTSDAPTSSPTKSDTPTKTPTKTPTNEPTSSEPTSAPTSEPTSEPPTSAPTSEPTSSPTTKSPTSEPTSGGPSLPGGGASAGTG